MRGKLERAGMTLCTLLMWQRLLVFFALAPLAFAQGTQIGGMIGRGGAAKLFEDSAYHLVAGVEGCVLCGGRLGLFLEYHHWKKTGEGTGNPTSLDLAGGGASHAVTCGEVGFGAAISVSEHWYVRPLARIVVLSTPEVGGFAGASVGYRF